MAKNTSNVSTKRYCANLEELSNADQYQRRAQDEFLPSVLESDDGVSRRSFLKVIGASAALAGFGTLSGCKRKTDETIVPYVSQPEGVVPGKPLYFATAMTLGGYAQGVIAESHEGRPTKLEGNPDQSASLGASDVFVQGSLLGLYRSRPLAGRQPSGKHQRLGHFYRCYSSAAGSKVARWRGSGDSDRNDHVPDADQPDRCAEKQISWRPLVWARSDRRYNIRAGLRQATGMEALPPYDFSKARVIVSFDCDFLHEEPGHLRYARDFSDGRRIRSGTADMNRLYVIESTHTITGTMADHRWAMRPSHIFRAAATLADAINNRIGSPAWASAAALDLLAHRGQCLIVAGGASAAGGSFHRSFDESDAGQCWGDRELCRAHGSGSRWLPRRSDRRNRSRRRLIF